MHGSCADAGAREMCLLGENVESSREPSEASDCCISSRSASGMSDGCCK